jgi:hypothetical protein
LGRGYGWHQHGTIRGHVGATRLFKDDWRNKRDNILIARSGNRGGSLLQNDLELENAAVPDDPSL